MSGDNQDSKAAEGVVYKERAYVAYLYAIVLIERAGI